MYTLQVDYTVGASHWSGKGIAFLGL